ATRGVVEAFLFALRDDRDVQEAAIRAAERFQEFQPDALPLLLEALGGGSAVVAYGVSRILSAVGRQERTSSAPREDLLTALAATIRGRGSRRHVYRFVGCGADEKNGVRIARFGRLDQAFYRAILEITGVIRPTG